MSCQLAGKQIPEVVCRELLFWLGARSSSKLACVNRAWRDCVLPQLYRRLLWEAIPSLDLARDTSPSMGALTPPLAGETWKSLFEALVMTRGNVRWRPVTAVSDSLSSASSSVPTASSSASSSSSSSASSSTHQDSHTSGHHAALATATEAVVDEAFVTSGPKVNRFMHMPLPDNYDSHTSPIAVPRGFEWVELKVNDPASPDFARLATFLNANALQDTDEQFKLGWTPVHFERQLRCSTPPVLQAGAHKAANALKPIYVSVQTDGTTGPKNLIAFIAAIPIELRVWNKVERFYLVRHLCVHKKVRGHRVARVVVKELSRRVHEVCRLHSDAPSSSGAQPQIHEKSQVSGSNNTGNSSHNADASSSSNTGNANNTGNARPCLPAIFTLGVNMPFRQICEFSAFHRTFQFERFVKAGLHPTIEQKDVDISHFKCLPNLAPFEMNDLPIVFPFVMSYLERFKIGMSYTGAEFAHRFGNRAGYTNSYVLWSSGVERKPVGFFSFSELKYEMLSPEVSVKALKIAYADIIFPSNNLELVKSMLVIAKDLGFDELEIGGNMEHEEIVKHEELHFKPGTGRALQFTHNWLCDEIQPKDWSLSENN